MRTIEAAARVAAAVVDAGPGEAGEVVDQMVDLAREEEVGEVETMTAMTTPTEVPVVVRGVVAVAVAELEGDEEAHHRHRPPGHRLPQTTYWTRTFSLVSPSFTLRPPRLNLTERRRRPPTTATQTSRTPSKTKACPKDHKGRCSP